MRMFHLVDMQWLRGDYMFPDEVKQFGAQV